MIGLAIGFRFSHLGHKVYWHDEVFTSLRVAGYIGQDVGASLFTGMVFPAEALLQYQRFPADSSLAKTWVSLTDHPEHPPGYYLLAFGWGQVWGASVVGYRGIAAVFGVLALPLVFWLSRELFPRQLTTAWIATTLFAVSPVQLIYSQEAREYSLWIVGMLLATIALLLAVRRKRAWAWVGYSVALTLSLYSSLVTVLLSMSHLVFILLTQKPRQWPYFALASGGAWVLFAPWLWVIWQNWQRLQSVTAWTKQSSPMGLLAKLWGLHYSATVVDFSLPLNHPFTLVVPPLLILAMLGAAAGLRRSSRDAGMILLLCMLLVPPLVLIGNDVLRSGQLSGTTRYFLPSLMVVPIIFAAWVSFSIESQHRWRQWIASLGLGLVLLVGTLSCLTNLQATTWWNKGASYHNPLIASSLNQWHDPPLVLVFSGDTALGNAISLSYLLRPQTPLRLFPQTHLTDGTIPWTELAEWPGKVFLYKPPAAIVEALPKHIHQSPYPLFPGDQTGMLVEIKR